MRNYTVALIIALLASSCASTRAKITEYRDRQERRAAAEHIVERTITKPEVSYVTVYKYIKLPDSLTAPCGPIAHAANRTVDEYVRVAINNTPVLEDCAERMDRIRAKQGQPAATEDIPTP